MLRNGKSIKAARIALRLRQNELATICGLRPETVNRIENGKDNVPAYLDMIVALLERDEANVRFAMERAGLL